MFLASLVIALAYYADVLSRTGSLASFTVIALVLILPNVFLTYRYGSYSVRTSSGVETRGTPSTRTSRWAIVAIVLAPVLLMACAVGLRVWVFGLVRIPRSQFGMFPTYSAGTRVVISKSKVRPGRGEVTFFAWPERTNTDFIQRVIAKDGDVLEVRDGHPWINGWAVPSCDVGDGSYDEGGTREEGTLAVEFLEGHAYLVFFARHTDGPRGTVRLVAKPGELLVLGDNRNHSYDSRSWFKGAGGGVSTVSGRPWSDPPLHVAPRLQAALDACLARRPARGQTLPPPP
jgi:signal peptidase I